ncbi:50S ribosomal protein L21 [Candidatus Gottesmanbacteria bacterium]|nr:50S ribosomal protein L21 [Candidatus Gottesmanbacteria bacterium]
MYAVIDIAGKQYKVSPEDKITTEKIEGALGDKLLFDKILLVKDGESILFGTPYINGFRVNGQIVSQTKSEKIKVSKFKAKVRYRKTTGYRPKLTEIKILSLVRPRKSQLTTVKK